MIHLLNILNKLKNQNNYFLYNNENNLCRYVC